MSIFHGEDEFFGPSKVQEAYLQHQDFFIFDGKQHPKNIFLEKEQTINLNLIDWLRKFVIRRFGIGCWITSPSTQY